MKFTRTTWTNYWIFSNKGSSFANIFFTNYGEEKGNLMLVRRESLNCQSKREPVNHAIGYSLDLFYPNQPSLNPFWATNLFLVVKLFTILNQRVYCPFNSKLFYVKFL